MRVRHRPKRNNASEPKHWLGEGTAGQESLLLELGPVQYFLDQSIATVSTSLFHRLGVFELGSYRGASRHDKPFSVLLPPVGAAGWQLGYLAKKFNVYLCADEADDHAYDAADRFGAKLISGAFSEELEHEIAFFLFTDERWADQATLADAIREANVHLAEEGVVSVALLGERRDDGTYICWSSGERTPLSDLQTDRSTVLGAPAGIHSVDLSIHGALDPGRISAFLKRNRDFLGRNARELLMERIRDEDFADQLRQAPPRLAILASWEKEAVKRA